MKCIEGTGRTVDEAVAYCLKVLKLEASQVDVEVIDEGSRAIFGLFGGKLAKVKVTAKLAEKASKESDELDLELEMKKILRGEDVLENAVDDKDPAVVFLRGIISKMGLKAKISKSEKEGITYLDVNGKSLGVLIGRRGDTLDSIQYLVNLVAAKHARESGDNEKIRYILDVEGYRKKREEGLVEMALKTAEKVQSEGKKAILEPMNAMERRLIHTALQDMDGITTYSEGRDPFRRIVIAPEND